MPEPTRPVMDTPGSAHPLHALFQPPALIAALLAGEGLALILSLAPGVHEDLLVRFGLASLGIQWVVLATIAALYACRRPLSRLSARSLAPVCLGVLLVMTLLVSAGSLAILGIAQPNAWQDGTRFVLHMLAIAIVVGLIGLVAYQNYWRARQLAVQAKQAQLEALQARIHPHFLFNTLNTSVALIHARPNEAERVLLDLADLFRSALRGPRAITLSEELALTRRYLDIEALRFGQRLHLGWEVPDDLPGILVPSLAIQPLAENAIRHGIEPRQEGGNIDVVVQLTTKDVIVVISNDMPAQHANTEGHSIGLASARERVRALTQGRGTVESEINDKRYVVHVRLPLP